MFKTFISFYYIFSKIFEPYKLIKIFTFQKIGKSLSEKKKAGIHKCMEILLSNVESDDENIKDCVFATIK